MATLATVEWGVEVGTDDDDDGIIIIIDIAVRILTSGLWARLFWRVLIRFAYSVDSFIHSNKL
ncbi:hypothetical protein BDN72DRAFT_841866 [Pluteus cervinus]|uniref:Uncharacterized protein n=1 Tax=Pluteus cervinus TaxID=181527 RepID=A0ACD3AT11_9AGAR|nr:hypothetical protein BDN72DRAFT_841866 [Pluteus cervinus]